MYKFRDWRTPRLPYETKAFLQDRQRIMDQTGRYILEYKYNNQNQRVYLYICGECGAHRQSCIVRLRQYTGHGCKECSRRLGENNAYTSFIKMKEILSTLSVPFRFPDHYTEDDFNTTIERVTDIGPDGTKWASKAVHPVTEYDGTIINDMSIAHIVYKFHNWQESSKLPYENETLVDDREIISDFVGHHLIEYKYNKTGYRVGLYICGNCGSYGVAGIIGLLNKSSGACIACKQITPYDEVNERVTKCGFNLITDKKDYIGASSIDVMYCLF